jgi:hypothetical protein
MYCSNDSGVTRQKTEPSSVTKRLKRREATRYRNDATDDTTNDLPSGDGAVRVNERACEVMEDKQETGVVLSSEGDRRAVDGWCLNSK